MLFDKKFREVTLVSLFVLFLGINLLDYVSTVVGLAEGKHEANWFAVWAMGIIGEIPALILIKIMFTVVIGITIWFVFERTKTILDDELLMAGLVALNVIGFFVLSSNFANLGWNLL